MNILSAKAVSLKTSLSIPHIRRATKERKFPQPIQLSKARMGWLESDIDNWVSGLVKAEQKGEKNA